MKKLLVYIKDFRLECVLAPLFKLLEASFELIVPLIMAAIIDKGIPTGDTGFIVRMCLWLVALGGVGLLSSVTAQYFSAKAAIGFSARLRHVLMQHIQTLSYTELDTVGTSTLITRMNSDINQVQTGVNMCLRLLLRSPFVVFGAMIMAFTIDTRCAMIFAGVIVALCIIVFSIMLITIPMYRHVQGQLDSVTATTRENLTGVRVIRAFCKEDAENEKFERKIQLLTRMQLRVGRISAMMNPVTYLVINAAVILLINTGALRVQMGALSQGQVVALYNYMSQILVELIKMANLIITLTKAAACGDRVASVLSVKSTQKDGEKTPALDAPHGSVVFDGVSMRYAGAGTESVSGVSFTAAPGSTVGVIGGTGSGQEHAGQPHPPLLRRDGRPRAGGRHGCARHPQRRAAPPHRRCAAEGDALQGHHPQQPPLGQRGRDRSRPERRAESRARRSTWSPPSPRGWTSRSSRAAATSPAASVSA